MGFLTHINKDNPVLNINDKPVDGFEGIYWVSPKGYIHNGRIPLKTYVINSGYLCLKFTVKNKRTSVLVHRIVAKAFIPNPENKVQVNHIDGNKQNNAVENLEWVTSGENRAHAKANNLWEYNKPTLGKKLGKTSRYHGVGFDYPRNKFYATVRVNGKTIKKRFNTEKEAAIYYNQLVDLYAPERQKNIIN